MRVGCAEVLAAFVASSRSTRAGSPFARKPTVTRDMVDQICGPCQWGPTQAKRQTPHTIRSKISAATKTKTVADFLGYGGAGSRVNDEFSVAALIEAASIERRSCGVFVCSFCRAGSAVDLISGRDICR
jgi:hypothetical protein